MATKHTSGEFGSAAYDVVAQAYRDAVSIMVYKNNKIVKVLQCQLHPQPGGIVGDELVLPSISPQPLVGGAQEDASGQLYASILASMVARQSPEDARSVVIGLGNIGPGDSVSPSDREELLFVIKLVEQARVW